jgi:flagellar hook-associated protein 2
MATRTYGLSGSGIDVDQMVKDLMKARRARYDALVQKKTQAEWKKADFNTLYSSIKSFRNTTVFNYKLESKLRPQKATSSSDSVATATALADAAAIDHSLHVDQLAAGVKKASASAITPAGNDKTSLMTQFGLADKEFTIKLTNGPDSKTITVDTTGSIYDFVSSVNSAGIGIRAAYDTTLDRVFLYTSNTGSAASIDFTGSDADGLSFLKDNLQINTQATFRGSSAAITTGSGTATLADQFGISGSFDITVNNGASSAVVHVDAAMSIDDLAAAISGAGVNIQAAYNAATDRFTLQTTNSGAAAGITFGGTGTDGMAFLQNNLKLNTTEYAQNGVDAIFDLDGLTNLSEATNTFTISGVSYSLKNTGDATVSIAPDIDATIANVKAFVEEYNKLITALTGELNEDVYKDFLPLTDEQKSEMSETEIKAWEAKAKSGMLRSDATLRNALYTLRNDMANKIEGLTGKYKSLADLGINTGSYFSDDGTFNTEWTEGGKLYVNETKLRQALETDPEAVAKIFGTDGADNAHDGIVNRLYDNLQAVMKKIEASAGSTAGYSTDTTSNLGRMLNDYDKRIAAFENRLKAEETRYYKQFDAMEVAISQMNKQSAWLAQQFSTGSSS